MDKKDIELVRLLTSIYYMMGIVEASGCKAAYDFVIEAACKAENLLFGEEL